MMLLDVDAGTVLNSAVETGRAIGDFGMMAITAGFFLVLSGLLMVFSFRWFMKMIESIMKDQKETMTQLLAETRDQNIRLNEIAEGLAPDNQLKIKTISNLFFDLGVEKVCRMIRRVRQENHIANKEAIREKVHKLVENLHNDRNSKLDSFTYLGKPLSAFTDPKWIDSITEVILAEVYNEAGENNGRAYTNVDAAYAQIRLDFYHNMTRIRR